METSKNFEKLKELIEKHNLNDEHKLLEYGTSALLMLSAVGKSTLLRNLVIGAIVVGLGKMAYDHFAEEEQPLKKLRLAKR